MTTKEKFNSIDQSKLSKEAVSTLTKMKKASDDFKNEAVTKKVDAALDQLIKRLKKEKPEAIKTVKKHTAKKTASKSTGSKGTVMKLAKEIRKEGESWRDAVKRAGEQIKKGDKKAVSEVKSEMDKLKDLIENDEILRGFKNSDVSRDAKLKAKPKGKRKSTAGWKNQYGASKGGRTYYESRENRSDRYSPKYPKDKPFLASGGHLAQGDLQQLDIANADLFAKGGALENSTYIPKEEVVSVKLKNGKEYENDFSDMPFLNGIYISDSDVTKEIDDENQMSLFKKGGRLPKDAFYIKRRDIDFVKYADEDEPEIAKGKNLLGGIWIDPKKQKMLIEEAKREGRLETGGHLAMDENSYLKNAQSRLKKVYKHLGVEYGQTRRGDKYVQINYIPKSVPQSQQPEFVKVFYDDDKELQKIGETLKLKLEQGGHLPKGDIQQLDIANADLFEKGGKTRSKRSINTDRARLSKEPWEQAYLPKRKGGYYAKGGYLGSHGLEEGDTIIRSEGGYQVVKDKIGNTVYVDLSNGYRDSEPPLPFEEGGEIDAFTLSTVRGNDETIIDSQDKKINFECGGSLNSVVSDSTSNFANYYLEKGGEIIKTNNEGAAKWELKITDKEGNTSSVYASKKSDLEQYAKTYLEKGGELNTVVDDSLSHFDNFYLMEGSGAGMFAKGGRLKSALNRDRKYYNQNESWERAYSKGKNRKGYGSFSKGGILSPIERYVLEIEGITGVRKTAVEQFISENNLSDEEVLHIVIGLGRKQLKASEFRSAAMGDSKNTKSVLKFAKSKKAVMLEKGGETRKIVVVNENVKYTPSKYKAIYKDYDKDGTVNIDDAFPLKSEKNQKVEQVELKETFDKLLDVKSELDGIMKDAVKTLDEKAPKGADIYARTKTPYSIIKKLVEKRMLDPDKGLTDMIGTTIAVDNQAQLEDVRDQIDNGLLGKVLDRDDYYKTPKAGYRAYHYIVEYKGVPVEVQLKTKQQKKLHEISHEYYKKGTLNPAGLNQVSILIEKSDSGNANAKAKVKELFKSKTNLGKKIASKTFKKGGAIEDLRKPMRNIDVYADDMFEKGGKVSFSQKAKAIAKNFEGKRVEPKYQKEYGKTYDKKEAMEVGNKIAGAYKAKHESKMEKGGTTGKKRGNPNSVFSLAKKIRKQGETWQAAVQRAKKQLQNEK